MHENDTKHAIRMPKALIALLRQKAHEHQRTLNAEMVVALWLFVGDREAASRVVPDGRTVANEARRNVPRALKGEANGSASANASASDD